MFDSASEQVHPIPDGVFAAGRERLAARRDHPGRLRSLWNMLKFSAAPYTEICARLQELETSAKRIDSNQRKMRVDKSFASSSGLFYSIAAPCGELDLEQSLKLHSRLIESVRKQTINYEDFQQGLGELRRRIIDELDSRHCFYLEQAKAKFYDVKNAFGEDVAIRFPSATVNIEEAGNCLALSRGTACVFHLMRVMESGLTATSKALGIPYAPSWESHLRQIDDKVKAKHKTKGVRWKRDEPFFRDVWAHLHAVKVAWRNPTMHIVRDYTPEQAEEIFVAVRAFMRHLATKLSEKKRS